MEILTLGEKIKAKRKEMNMTLKDLAGDRITPGQISLVESGKSKPSIDLLEYISERLDTDIDYFLETEEKQASRICEFYSNIAEAAVNADNVIRAEESIQRGLHYAEKYALVYFKAKLDLIYANLKYNHGEYEEAQQYCILANSTFLKTDSIDDVVKSFILLGAITYKMGYITTALNYFMQGDNILNENNHIDELLKAQIYYYISLCYSKINSSNQAIDYAILAKDKLKVLNNKKEYAETLMILSIAYSQENKINEALKYAKEARKIFSELNDVHELAGIETNLGAIFAKGNDMEESFNHLNKALKLKKEIQDDTIPETIFKICNNYIQMNEFDKALEAVNDLVDIIKDEQHEYRIKCFEYLYKIHHKIGNMGKAEEILLNAIKYVESLGYEKQLADFDVMLGKLYMDIEERELALIYINRGLDLYRSIGILSNK